MKGMSKKKIGGFMCHSPAATAVCMTPDSRSVIVPGRRSTTERNIITNCNTFNDQNGRSFNSIKYSKLIDYRRNHHHHNNNNNNQSSQTKLITNSITTNDNSNNGLGGDNNINKTQVILRPASMIKTEQALRNNISSNYNDKQIVKLDDLHKSSSVLDSVPDNVFQVVVLRVSLHCQGCAGKLKKHIAKMEGVTSFSIELEHKRVTVMGHVSPVVVLENISKVRRAEFWPTPASTDQYHHL